MGYLSQKKSQNRKSLFFKASSIIVILWSLLLVYNPDIVICRLNLFHLYLLSFLLLILSLCARNFKSSAIFLLSLIICFTNLSSACDIFLSDSFSGKTSLSFNYSDQSPRINLTSTTTSSGTIILADKHHAFYTTTPQPLTLIQVNLQSAKPEEYPLIFKHLHQFIVLQDNPVIVFGDFGIPAWHKPFRKFLSKSGLSVKNKLLFSREAYNIFSNPTFYILGFREMGISDISVDDSSDHQSISATVSFNPMRF